ncbi:GMC family oxidoreductase [Phanerochaete sordida]|uniref:GMC family oxidoreductase n=1 Tax=Phanerochaete sordida TaxID=48140 RepID=A0A9P3G3B4_9APHY|nr:GMC family oxidoreductase [Phanerochaete sordida]
MLTPTEQLNNQFFDYIIAGGGTAGLTLAARLTEDPSVNVLVLEAGQANIDDPQLLRPGIYGSHFGNASFTWDHKTIKQKHVNDRESGWSRGKGLGGSSGINFLCYTKPPARDIDDFERLGNPGWNWKNLEQYFNRAEGFVEPTEEYKKRTGVKTETWNVGREGPLKVSFPVSISEAEMRIQQAFANQGIPAAKQPIGGDPKGICFLPNTYDPKTHVRSYSTNAYYLPNKDRPNFKVAVGAHVNRVLTENTRDGSWSAVGVEFTDVASGKTQTVNAKKEVILSAGALKTPQLLELSGFGRIDVLDKIDVPVKVELSGVGENVQDHIFLGLSWELKEDAPFDTLDLLRDPAIAAKHLELHAQGSGLHTIGIVGFSWNSFDMFAPPGKQAEVYQKMEDALGKIDDTAHPGLRKSFEIAMQRFEPGKPGSPGCEFISFPGFLSGPNPPEAGKRYATILVAMNHGFSRGTVHATSSDPLKDPEMDAHYFEQDFDLDIHVEMVKFARKVANTSPMKEMLVAELNPGLEVQTDAQWAEWLKQTFSTTWHTAGSAAMLPRAQNGVVDASLKVYGTSNLRVVDLSVVPLHFASHPQATVYAIAEKAADIIKAAA